MKSFKDYAKTATDTDTVDTQRPTADAETLTKKIAQAYHGKSDRDMLKNILAEAEKSKRAGTLSNQEIDAFYDAFAPMLDAAKRKQLRMVVERLKNL